MPDEQITDPVIVDYPIVQVNPSTGLVIPCLISIPYQVFTLAVKNQIRLAVTPLGDGRVRVEAKTLAREDAEDLRKEVGLKAGELVKAVAKLVITIDRMEGGK